MYHEADKRWREKPSAFVKSRGNVLDGMQERWKDGRKNGSKVGMKEGRKEGGKGELGKAHRVLNLSK